LQGLSPKENREIPPLRYELAYQLKTDFPELTIAINGGITRNDQIADHLKEVDGVMIGREAYYNPWLLTTWDEAFFNSSESSITREAVEEAMVAYMERANKEDGCPWYAIARHMLGLYHGQRGGRLWRQVWSNHKLKPMPPREVMAIAREALARGAEVPA
jgi:tRNA-dihydrouridine synthase A